MTDSTSGMLEQARRRAGLSHSELWFRYFELGGRCTVLAIEAYLCSALALSDHDRALLAAALEPESLDEHPMPPTDEAEKLERRD